MSKKKSATSRLVRWLIIGLVVIVGGGILARTMGWLDPGDQVHVVETDQAELRTITRLVSASGRMQPETEVIIRPDVSGEIIELNVQEGDFVREGDLLLRIRPDIYQAQIEELNAALLTQQSRMEQARSAMLQSQAEFETQQQLYERELISRLEFLQAQTTYESNQASFRASEYQVESSRAQLRRAEEELQQTVIRAPQDGTISFLGVERGERVLGQTQTTGTEMMRVARLDEMEVVANVNENDIVNVSPGDTTMIEVDAYPDRVFNGIVTQIANSAETTGSGTAEQVTNYEVRIRVITPHNLSSTPGNLVEQPAGENPQLTSSPNFKPGMSATVDIRSMTVTNVVSVPIQAVTVREESEFQTGSATMEGDMPATGEPVATTTANSGTGNSAAGTEEEEEFRRVVFIVNDGVVRMQEVTTGISDNRYIQVQSGLQPGDEVVTGSYRILSTEISDGDRVEISNNNNTL